MPSSFPSKAGLCLILSIFGIASQLTAADEFPETLYLQNGNQLSGTSVGVANGQLQWKLPGGQEILVPLEAIDHIEVGYPASKAASANPEDSVAEDGERGPEIPGSPADSTEELTESDTETADGSPTSDAVDVAEEAPPRFFRMPFATLGEPQEFPPFVVLDRAYDRSLEKITTWTKRVELGGRFLDGNRNQDYVDFSAKFERDFGGQAVNWEAGGQFGQSEGIRNANRWHTNGTVDFAKENQWIFFITSKNEYDEFEHLDYRGTFSGGLGYRFFNEKDRRLITRVGPGMTHEVFSDPDRQRTTPDVFIESEMRWPIFERVAVENKATLTPSIADLETMRLLTDSGLLFRLDNDERWLLKLGLRLEYNSAPNPGRKPRDYTSSILLVYTRK